MRSTPTTIGIAIIGYSVKSQLPAIPKIINPSYVSVFNNGLRLQWFIHNSQTADKSLYTITFPVSVSVTYNVVTTTGNRSGGGTGTPSVRGVEAIAGSIKDFTGSTVRMARVETGNPVYLIVIGKI